LIAAAVLLAACGGERPETMLVSAKAFLAKNDTKAAVIQIKNALQKDPNLPEARYLLGMALLDVGDLVGAEAELRKALELKFPRDQVIPPLAKAILGHGNSKKLIDEFSKTELSVASAKADLQVSLALAYSDLGKTELSDAALDAALVAQAGFAPAKLVQARSLSSDTMSMVRWP